MGAPNVRVIGPRLAPTFALGFALCRTLLQSVPLVVGYLRPGRPGGQVGRQRAPPVAAQARAEGELRRVERVDGKRLGGVRKRRRILVVVVVVVLE